MENCCGKNSCASDIVVGAFRTLQSIGKSLIDSNVWKKTTSISRVNHVSFLHIPAQYFSMCWRVLERFGCNHALQTKYEIWPLMSRNFTFN